MPKATLEFDLSDSEDKQEFDRTSKATDMAMMLWELMLNGKKKFYRQLETDGEATEREFELIDKVWVEIWDLAKEYNIEIENLIS